MTRLVLIGLVFLLALSGPLHVERSAAAKSCDSPTVIDDATASTILKTKRPFSPTNLDLFSSYSLPAWEDAAPDKFATGPGPTAAETRTMLRTFLRKRFPCSDDRVLEGLAVFDHPSVKQKIPDPTLRAALAALI